MAYPVASSPISPVNLPQPYDITAAIHQAMKFELPREIPHLSTTGQDQEIHDSISPGDTDELMPNVIDTCDFIDEAVWNDVTLPEEIAETDAWGENTSANIYELERFCRYIDGDTETEEESEDSYGSPHKRLKTDCKRKFNIMAESHGASSTLQYLQVELANSELWEEFNQIGTEMVITKNGRYV